MRPFWSVALALSSAVAGCTTGEPPARATFILQSVGGDPLPAFADTTAQLTRIADTVTVYIEPFDRSRNRLEHRSAWSFRGEATTSSYFEYFTLRDGAMAVPFYGCGLIEFCFDAAHVGVIRGDTLTITFATAALRTEVFIRH